MELNASSSVFRSHGPDAVVPSRPAPGPIPGLDANYDGPIFVSDVNDTVRSRRGIDRMGGEDTVFDAVPLLQGVARLGVPIVYLSDAHGRSEADEQQFATEHLPAGTFVGRDAWSWRDLLPGDAEAVDPHGRFKTTQLEQLQQAYPHARLFALGDDEYADAQAYQNAHVTAYIRNVRPDQQTLPPNFGGLIVDDYAPPVQQRILGDLANAVATSTSLGGRTDAPQRGVPAVDQPLPIPRASWSERLMARLSLLRGRMEAHAHNLYERFKTSRDALDFAQATSNVELMQWSADDRATLVEALLQDHDHARDLCDTQVLRVLTAQGADAGHIDAVLSRIDPHVLSERLEAGGVRERLDQFHQIDRALPGDWSGWNRYVDALTGTQARPDTRVEPLINGDVAFPAMLSAIDGARNTVAMTVFAFQSDAAGWQFARHLADAAQRGVQVELIYDPAGSAISNGARTDPALFDFLCHHGVTVVAQTPGVLDDHLTHRKILVVDGETGFLGGMNVGDEYRDIWHDVHARVTGPAVADLQALVDAQFKADTASGSAPTSPVPPARQAGAAPPFPAPPATSFPPGAPTPASASDTPAVSDRLATSTTRVVGHQGLGDLDLKKMYLRAIDTAQTSIRIANPYVSDPDILARLAAAARRGVRVDLVLPHFNNHGLEQDAERSQYDDLIAAGVHLYEYQGRPMAHDKVATFDGIVSTIGSSNLDARSLYNNDEANIWVVDPALARRLDDQLFDADLTSSLAIDHYQPGVFQRVLNRAADALSPEL